MTLYINFTVYNEAYQQVFNLKISEFFSLFWEHDPTARIMNFSRRLIQK